MKTTTTLTPVAIERQSAVKKHLITGAIYLTSEKFAIFAGVIAALACWWGAFTEEPRAIGAGAILWACWFALWAWRKSYRSLRNERLGHKR